MKKKLLKTIAITTAAATVLSTAFSMGVMADEADAAVQEEIEGEAPSEAGESEGEAASDEGESDGESASAPVEAAVAEAAGNGMLTKLQAGTHEILVYYPNDNATDLLPITTSCTAPLFVVLGDGKFDADSAAKYAEETGLDLIAAGEGSSIVFINPLGDAWTAEDAGAFEAVVDLVDDSSTSDHANGITESLNFFTQATEQKIAATTGRMYLYGDGSGAQFIVDNYLCELITAKTYGDGVTIEFNNTITGCTVNGVESVGELAPTDIPVVAIGCSDEVNQALEAASGVFLADETADYAGEYEAVIGNYRRQAGVIIPIIDYEAEGIVENIETFTVNTSPDNVTFEGTDTHDVSVVTYYAEYLDVEAGNVPLVLCFHGGGNTALFEAMAAEWPLIGKDNGFITVSVDLHYPNVTAAETVELISMLEEEYSIDPGRIYASGFSMGSIKSWDLFEQYPELFAGLAPMDASEVPGNDSFGNPVESINQDVIVPVFYVGGELSPLAELPCQDVKLVDQVAYLFGVNQVAKDYDVSFDSQDTWENPFWGINGDITYAVTDTTFTDSTLTVELFQSTNGKYYTALALSGNQSHEVYARNSWAAWDFLSQFSRDENGEIVIGENTYARPSDDGSVADNSYQN